MSQNTDKAHVDLPRNWHSTSIAVKITAVVVWGVMPIAFALTIPLLSSIENEIGKDNLWQLEHLHRFIDQQFQDDYNISDDVMRKRLLDFREHYNFEYLKLKYHDQKVVIGKDYPESAKYAHNYIYEDENKPFNLSLTVHFQPTSRGIELERMKYGSLIVIFTIILGLYLVYVIRNTLDAPFQRVIDATQNVIYGDLETRLDIKSDDEFGHLSRFFNHMIQKLSQQQNSLTKANKYLESVVHNKEMALAESRSKSLFLANMSHEIRTPMTAILGYTESLYHNRIIDGSEKRDALEAIYRNSKHLIDIINDILDLSKIEADKLQVENISFSPLKSLMEVEQLMLIQAKEKGVRLEFDYHYPIPDLIQNDPTRFKQVLFNLISNALRFTDEGKVTVSIGCSFEEQQLHISVIDDGIGLSREQIQVLFQPYVQAETSTSRQFGGTGLGLMISKRLVNLMGGDINVHSAPGKGATFKFDISTGSLSDSKVITEKNTHTKLAIEDFDQIPDLHGNVLLAEDIEDNQKLITLYLRQAGLHVDIAENGQRAVDMASDCHYDLILMDMQMPIMDGLTATSTLRESHYNAPIIALTANVLKNERAIYLNAGCNDILTKPIIIDDFYETIEKWLGQEQSTEEQSPQELSAKQSLEIKKAQHQESINSAFNALVSQFTKSLEQEIFEIDQNISQQDWEKCQKLIHNIKGRGGSFGFPEITVQATELEVLLRSEQYDQFEKQFGFFKEFLFENIIKVK